VSTLPGYTSANLMLEGAYHAGPGIACSLSWGGVSRR
jgi:hypothetical protein